MSGQEVITYRGHEIRPAYDPGEWVAAKVERDNRNYLHSPVTGDISTFKSIDEAKSAIDYRTR